MPEQALRVGELVPRATLHPRVVAWADANAGDCSPWCIALSGGADSLALLFLLWAHWPESRRRLTALHFNHRLRGAASDEDEEFSRTVCQSLGVAFRSASWTKQPERVSENAARAARHAFFAEAMSMLGARVLWTGHQKNDIAETQLMRLARGSGTGGLSAPRPVRVAPDERIFLRPLLTVTKKKLQEALRAAGAVWREDATNSSENYFRNRIRNFVTPAWEEAAVNDALDGAALSREKLEEDDSALEAWLDELSVVHKSGAMNLAALVGKPRALLRRALHRWPMAARLDRQGFEELLALCERGRGRMSVGEGFALLVDRELRFETSPPAGLSWTPATLHSCVILFMPDGARLSAQRVEFSSPLRARIFAGQVQPATEAFIEHFDDGFTVRPWAVGDRFRPLGAPGSAKLQDLFINRKIPVERRALLPVICAADGGIIWVPGFPPAEYSKVTQQSVMGLQLTYHTGTSNVRD